ncbi:MAG: pyridoxal phosphate-dependent aminotransferase [Chitinivibrionales bacterium]
MEQTHGSIPWKYIESLGIEPGDVADFSASVNPFSNEIDYSGVIEGINPALYPDRENREFIDTLSEHYGVPQEMILPCSGTTELIYSLPLIWRRLLVFDPVYSDYEDAYTRYNRPIVSLDNNVLAQGEEGIRDHLSGRAQDWDICVIVNPNNPDGKYIRPDIIAGVAKAFDDKIFCIDESYQETGIDCASGMHLPEKLRNVVVLRSLTKSYGLAGLRCGYGIASEPAAGLLRRMVKPWNINIYTQKLIPRIFRNYRRYKEHWTRILKNRKELCESLSGMGWGVDAAGKGPFFLVSCRESTDLRKRLLDEYLINVRDCASFGMPQSIRIMPGNETDNNRLIKALSKLQEFVL